MDSPTNNLPARLLFTARLRLRPLAGSDFPNILKMDRDKQVVRYTHGWTLWGNAPPKLPNMARGYKTRLLARRGFFGFWVVQHRWTKCWLGWVQLESRPGARCEIGYRFLRQAWGKGFATEAASRLLYEAYRQHGLKRVYARVVEHNHASRRVLEKMGLREVPGKRIDCGPWKGALKYEGDWRSLGPLTGRFLFPGR